MKFTLKHREVYIPEKFTVKAESAETLLGNIEQAKHRTSGHGFFRCTACDGSGNEAYVYCDAIATVVPSNV